jgi:hypothetical protein
MIDAPWYVDLVLATVMILAAMSQYAWISFSGHSTERWLLAIGWTGLAGRLAYSLIVDGNVMIALASVPFLVMIAGGTALSAWRQLVMKPPPKVQCLQEPEFLCQREDRIREAILRRH